MPFRPVACAEESGCGWLALLSGLSAEVLWRLKGLVSMSSSSISILRDSYPEPNWVGVAGCPFGSVPRGEPWMPRLGGFSLEASDCGTSRANSVVSNSRSVMKILETCSFGVSPRTRRLISAVIWIGQPCALRKSCPRAISAFLTSLQSWIQNAGLSLKNVLLVRCSIRGCRVRHDLPLADATQLKSPLGP